MSRMSSLNQSTSMALGEAKQDATTTPRQEQELTISQMSRLFGVSLRTLRFYEDRGLIKPRREGNARYYHGVEKIRMEMILKGKKLGFTLTEIQDLIGGKGANETLDLEEQLQPQQIVNQIGHLERQRSEIDSAIERLRATHNRLLAERGSLERGDFEAISASGEPSGRRQSPRNSSDCAVMPDRGAEFPSSSCKEGNSNREGTLLVTGRNCRMARADMRPRVQGGKSFELDND